MPPRNVFRHGGTRRKHSTRPTARSPPRPCSAPSTHLCGAPGAEGAHGQALLAGVHASSGADVTPWNSKQKAVTTCGATTQPHQQASILPGPCPNPFCSPKTQLLLPCLFYGCLPQPGTSWAPSCPPLLAFPTCQPDASSLKCPLSLQPQGTSPLVPLCGHFGAAGRGRGEPPSSAPLPTPRPAGRCLFLQMLNSAPLVSAWDKTWGKEGREVAHVPKHAGRQL